MRLTWAFHVDSIEFTPSVIDGTDSLGGSESACLGLARALVARGHHVYLFTPQLHAQAPAVDHAGVHWYHTEQLPAVSRFVDWDVFVALRLPQIFNLAPRAALRILWNQDLMVGEAAKLQTMATGWAYDAVAYVSGYHRKQWETLIPELAPIGWVTKNGYDPSLVPTTVVKRPHQIIHISRPERGLRPLLAMWPELRRRVPDAELHLCRYNSMYDAQGWGRICAAYDAEVQRVNAEVGGITYLGELGKPALYQAIAESAVMWYPGVHDFAETSCIAALEAQACGTPFVGSFKGALPETVPHGLLIAGDAMSPEYQQQSLDAVERILSGRDVSGMVAGGRAHVQGYTYDVIAAEWETFVLDRFQSRMDTQGPAVLKRLLHEDDHMAAQVLAREMGDTTTADWCQYVIDGKDQGREDYAERAMAPADEIERSPRLDSVLAALAGRTRLWDLACGNGSTAVAFALANPSAHVVGVDYAAGNIAVARAFADAQGVADRVTFICAPVYDFDRHAPTAELAAIGAAHGPFDAAFIGEFLEHIAQVPSFLAAVHRAMTPGARIVCTMPAGPFGELAYRGLPIKRGHVTHFRPLDLQAQFGAQADLDVGYLDTGISMRGSAVGHWFVSYTPNGQPIGPRPLAQRILTTRPMQTLSVGLICNDTTDLRRCLSSVWPVADEIVIGDTGADPVDLARIVEAFAPTARVVSVGAVPSLHGGFAEARNTVLRACTGHWFLWIDSDEQLMFPHAVGKYLEGGVFTGYGLKQHHLMLDTPNTFDTPIRLFRRQPDIEFYGCIHEQPQQGHCNGDIVPALQLNDVEIAHIGYLHEGVRRKKALERNLPLLLQDREVFPTRRLGILLVLRDALNLATWSRDEARGEMTPAAKRYYQQVMGLFEAYFADPADKYHALARPFYEAAVKQVSGAMEIEIAFAAQQQGLKGRAKPERLWVREAAQIPALLDAKVKEWTKPLQPPPPIDVAPLEVPQAEGVPV